MGKAIWLADVAPSIKAVVLSYCGRRRGCEAPRCLNGARVSNHGKASHGLRMGRHSIAEKPLFRSVEGY
jgi:hypothetical protein